MAAGSPHPPAPSPRERGGEDLPQSSPGKAVQVKFGISEVGQVAFGFVVQDETRPGPERLAEIGVSGYQELYRELIRRGWRWQKAAFMSWRAAPRVSRQPATQEELAKMLGYRGDAIFRRWLAKPEQGPLMERIIGEARRLVFEINLSSVDHRTIERATAEDSTVQERKLFYDMYERLAGESGSSGAIDELGTLSDEELDQALERLEQIAA